MASSSLDANRLNELFKQISRHLGCSKEQEEAAQATFRDFAKSPHAVSLPIWPDCASFVKRKLDGPSASEGPCSGDYLMAHRVGVHYWLNALGGIAEIFFSKSPKTRVRIYALRQDISLRYEESISIYSAFAFFFYEQLYPAMRDDTLSTTDKSRLFYAFWYLFLMTKRRLSTNHTWEYLETIFLLLSMMTTVQSWAAQLDLFKIEAKNPSSSSRVPSSASTPSTSYAFPTSESIHPIQQIVKSRLPSWKRFHAEVFEPYANASLRPLFPGDSIHSPNLDTNRRYSNISATDSVTTLDASDPDLLSRMVEQFLQDSVDALNASLLEQRHSHTGENFCEPNEFDGMDWRLALSIENLYSSTLSEPQLDAIRKSDLADTPSNNDRHDVTLLSSANVAREGGLSNQSPFTTSTASSSATPDGTNKISPRDVSTASTPSSKQDEYPTSQHKVRPNLSSHPTNMECMHWMHQIQIALKTLLWLHSHIASPITSAQAEKQDAEGSPRNTSSGRPPINAKGRRYIPPQHVQLAEELIPQKRLLELESMMENWLTKLSEKSLLSDYVKELVTGFFYRVFLYILANDRHQSSIASGNPAAEVKSDLLGKNELVGALFAISYSLVLHCACRCEYSAICFPTPLHVVHVLIAYFTKTLFGVSKIIKNAPGSVAKFFATLEERILVQELWRKDSLIYSWYTPRTQGLFSYILGTCGNPTDPKMSIQTALSDASVIEKFQAHHASSSTASGPADTVNEMCGMVLSKILLMGGTLISNMGRALLPSVSQRSIFALKVELFFAYVVTYHLNLLSDVHVHTIVLCCIQAINHLSRPKLDQFEMIVAAYLQPSIELNPDYAVHLVPLSSRRSPTTGEIPLGTVFEFYKEVFQPATEATLAKFRPKAAFNFTASPSYRHQMPFSSPSDSSNDSVSSAPNGAAQKTQPNQALPAGAKQNRGSAPGRFTALADDEELNSRLLPVARKLDFSDAVLPSPSKEDIATRSQGGAGQRKPAKTAKPPSRQALLPMVPTPPRTRPQPQTRSPPSMEGEDDHENSDTKPHTNTPSPTNRAQSKPRRSPPSSPSTFSPLKKKFNPA